MTSPSYTIKYLTFDWCVESLNKILDELSIAGEKKEYSEARSFTTALAKFGAESDQAKRCIGSFFDVHKSVLTEPIYVTVDDEDCIKTEFFKGPERATGAGESHADDDGPRFVLSKEVGDEVLHLAISEIYRDCNAVSSACEEDNEQLESLPIRFILTVYALLYSTLSGDTRDSLFDNLCYLCECADKAWEGSGPTPSGALVTVEGTSLAVPSSSPTIPGLPSGLPPEMSSAMGGLFSLVQKFTDSLKSDQESIQGADGNIDVQKALSKLGETLQKPEIQSEAGEVFKNASGLASSAQGLMPMVAEMMKGLSSGGK